MNTTRISAKNLGLLKLPFFCKRCFYLEMKFWNRDVPFRFPPARLINSLDRFQKKMVQDYCMEHGTFPKWLGEFARAVECVEVGKLRIEDEPTGLTVTGIPDLVLKFRNGRFGVVDFKTAPYQDGKDKLKPMYEVQVNAYAYLLDILEDKKISKGGFAYFEGDTGQLGCVPHEQVTDTGHNLPFRVSVEEIKLNPARIIQPLLDQVREIYDLEEPPEPKEGCKNCERLAEYVELISGTSRVLKDAIRFGCFKRPEKADLPGVMDLWDYTES